MILSLNHVAGDGTGGVLLLASIARADADDRPTSADPTDVRDLRAGLVWRRKTTTKRDKRPDQTARIAIHGGQPGVSGSAMAQLRFEASLIDRILSRRAPAATLNDVLLGSLAVAIRRFNDARGVPAAVSLVMPIDVRPPGPVNDIVSNIFFIVSLPVLPDAQSDLASAQVAVAERTRVVKAHRAAGDLKDSPPIIGGVLVGILHFGRPKLVRLAEKLLASRGETAVLTNVGRLDTALDFGEGVGPATEVDLPARADTAGARDRRRDDEPLALPGPPLQPPAVRRHRGRTLRPDVTRRPARRPSARRVVREGSPS